MNLEFYDEEDDGGSSSRKSKQDSESRYEKESAHQIRMQEEQDMQRAANNMRLNINLQLACMVTVALIGYWGPWMSYQTFVSDIGNL